MEKLQRQYKEAMAKFIDNRFRYGKDNPKTVAQYEKAEALWAELGKKIMEVAGS